MNTSFSTHGIGDNSLMRATRATSIERPTSRGRSTLPRSSNLNDALPNASNTPPSQLSTLRKEVVLGVEEYEEGAKPNKSLQIDMKSMVGDSVGNMSISPTSRDIVLAARKGLFIIDLEAPLELPRFLPQGGTWDVADVQWNPSPSHAEYIVSTSSERMLIWNLYLVGKTSIEFILQSHYRAITDINWHTFDPDLVCSTGIDSWIWAWDIRDTQKPAFGLCAFNAGGTQIKWNRKDGNILASSHYNEVLIWDRRKGSVPVSRTKMHDAKIYGIDWSHTHREQLITCSLDKTIKVWNIRTLTGSEPAPLQVFHAEHPVWRARDLPFGHGVLSLPQRGNAVLEMWSYDNAQEPIDIFDGHNDVVKEFVWRKRVVSGGLDYQLITWSKDQTLRLWPFGREKLQKVGAQQEGLDKGLVSHLSEDLVSFRSPPIGTGHLPILSAPRGQRSILAGVRATPLSAQPNLRQPHLNSASRSQHETARFDAAVDKSQRILALQGRNGTMTKGNAKGGRPRVDAALWLSSFRPESVGPSRLSSGSRPSSNVDRESSITRQKRRSISRTRHEDGSRESTSLLDEINTVVNKLSSARVKLERHDLTKHRTCTFGIHGPWGESKSVNVFVRVTFMFPPDYPSERGPEGTPSVEIERSPLISVKRRAYMRKRLKEIRESQRPCLELCLRFLLLADGVRRVPGASLGAGSSDEEDIAEDADKSKDFSSSLIRDHPNLAEPRSSQGVFGPNGQLVCIFRSLPRVVKNALQDLSATPAVPSRESDGVPRLFRSPSQLADAVRRLATAAHDHSYDFLDSRDPEDTEDVLRVMNNLLAFTHSKTSNFEPEKAEDVNQTNFSLLPTRTTVVHIKNQSYVVGAHKVLAEQYSLAAETPYKVCIGNIAVARRHFRTDHERFLNSLSTILKDTKPNDVSNRSLAWFTHHARSIIAVLHEQALRTNDIQLLGLFSVIVLTFDRLWCKLAEARSHKSKGEIVIGPSTNIPLHTEYFSVRRSNTKRGSTSFYFAHETPSPVSPAGQSLAVTQSLSSSSSSRGSWSSFMNTEKVRHLMGSSQEQGRVKPSPARTQSNHRQDKRVVFSRPSSSIMSVVDTESPFHPGRLISPDKRLQLIAHVLAYAEMLYSWRLYLKRAELFNATKILDPLLEKTGLDVNTICEKCLLPLEAGICIVCSRHKFPLCILCRTPVKGISHCCIACSHVSHMKCWTTQRFTYCPAGCGCECAVGSDA